MEYVYSNKPIEVAAHDLSETIREHLDIDDSVLLLLSGGSSIQIATIISRELSGCNLSNLAISLTDERYGKPGHHDENWQQLVDEGLNLPGATLYRPLQGNNIIQTVSDFENWLQDQLDHTGYKIGIFGIGTDGHTAGIKPESPATKTTGLASSFQGDDYQRVTMSFNAIRQLDEAVVQVSGQDKRQVLSDFIHKDMPLSRQPAQILKEVPKVTIYSNLKEDL